MRSHIHTPTLSSIPDSLYPWVFKFSSLDCVKKSDEGTRKLMFTICSAFAVLGFRERARGMKNLLAYLIDLLFGT